MTSRSQRISAGPRSAVCFCLHELHWDGEDTWVRLADLWAEPPEAFGYFVDRLIQHGLVAVIVGQQRQEIGHVGSNILLLQFHRDAKQRASSAAGLKIISRLSAGPQEINDMWMGFSVVG